MKRLAFLALIAVALGFVAYALTRRMPTPTAPQNEVAWLVNEFRLTPEQAREIEALHAAYAPVCARHCAEIFTVRARLAELAHDGETQSPEYLQAKAEMARLIDTCTRSTRAHLESVATVMPPEAAQRYLSLVEPKLSRHDHAQPIGLQ